MSADQEVWNHERDIGPVELPHKCPEVEFDDGATDRMTVEWASRGMKWLRKNRSTAFVDMMVYGVFGIEQPARKPGRPPKDS